MKRPEITKGEWECSPGRYKGNKTMNVSTEEANILFRSVNINAKPREEEKANAKAISAVPEMIDALMKVKKTQSKNYGNATNLHLDMIDVVKEVESALKKAGATEL